VISDNGIDLILSWKKGIGIQNMLSRTNECSGVFNIKSKKGGKSSQLLFQLNKTILI
jgi:signal transduction histidine kinase